MKQDKIERGIILYVWVYAIIISLVLLFWGVEYTIVFALGVATNLLCFTTTIKAIDRVLKYDYEHPKRVFIINNLLKLLIYTVVLAVVGLKYKDAVLIILCFVGMLSVKIMIYVKHLIIEPLQKKIENKNKKEDEQ